VSDADRAAPPAGGRRFMELPRYLRPVSGAAELAETLDDICHEMGFRVLCTVTGRSASRGAAGWIGAEVPAAAAGAILRVVDSTSGEVRRLLERSEFLDADAVLAIGGGRAIDVAKAACLEAGKPVISSPTQLAADGIASPISVIQDDDGAVQSIPGRLPVAVVCDLDMVASAPIETLRAGLGDLASNATAILDWRLAEAAGREEVDDFAALLSQAAADLALSGDLSALVEGPPGHDLLRRLLEGLVLSGLAMEIAGSSRPCSGAEHLISHSLDRLAPGTAMHGEQVALGTVIAAHLQGADWRSLRAQLYLAGLADAVAGFGLARETLVRVVQGAPGTRPDRYTVLDQADLSDVAVGAVVEEALGG
jgi:glycerol-1-phosphate dehydrogenase [NAD(P)+]